jgi:transposase
MKPYSIDLRTRILEDCDAGLSTRVVATKYRVSESWVRRLKQRRRETGKIAPRRAGTKQAPKWLAYRDQIRQLVDEQPDATLDGLRTRLGKNVNKQTLSQALRALQLTFKKSAPCRRTGPSGCPRASHALARLRFKRTRQRDFCFQAIAWQCRATLSSSIVLIWEATRQTENLGGFVPRAITIEAAWDSLELSGLLGQARIATSDPVDRRESTVGRRPTVRKCTVGVKPRTAGPSRRADLGNPL